MSTAVDSARLAHRREEARRLKEAAMVRRASSTSTGSPAGPNETPASEGATTTPRRTSSPSPLSHSGSPARGESASDAALEAKRMRRVLSGRPAAGSTVPSTYRSSAGGTDSPLGSRRPSETGSEASTASALSDLGSYARSSSFSTGEDRNAADVLLMKQQARMLRSTNSRNGTPPANPDKAATGPDDFTRRMQLRAQMRGIPNGSSPGSLAGSPRHSDRTAGAPPRPPATKRTNTPTQSAPPVSGPISAAMRRHMANKAGARGSSPAARGPPPGSAPLAGPRGPSCSKVGPGQMAPHTSSAGSVRAGSPQAVKLKPAATAPGAQPKPARPTASRLQVAGAEDLACSPWNAGEEIHALRAARKKLSKEGFMAYIYTNFPPKQASRKHNAKLDVKKQMQKALSHYHPDKQNVVEHGPQWLLVCEEVCKEITRMYNKRSGPP